MKKKTIYRIINSHKINRDALEEISSRGMLGELYKELGLDEIEKDKYAVLRLRRAAKQGNPEARMMVEIFNKYQNSLKEGGDLL